MHNAKTLSKLFRHKMSGYFNLNENGRKAERPRVKRMNGLEAILIDSTTIRMTTTKTMKKEVTMSLTTRALRRKWFDCERRIWD
jgi:hypothetical protein